MVTGVQSSNTFQEYSLAATSQPPQISSGNEQLQEDTVHLTSVSPTVKAQTLKQVAGGQDGDSDGSH